MDRTHFSLDDPGTASDSELALTSASVMPTGEDGDFGDGAQTGTCMFTSTIYFFHHYEFHRHRGGGYRDAWVHNPVHRLNCPCGGTVLVGKSSTLNRNLRDRTGRAKCKCRDLCRIVPRAQMLDATRVKDIGMCHFRFSAMRITRRQHQLRRDTPASDRTRVTTQGRQYQNQEDRWSQALEVGIARRNRKDRVSCHLASSAATDRPNPQQDRSDPQTPGRPRFSNPGSMSQPRVRTSSSFVLLL